MADVLMRLGILILALLLITTLIWGGRLFVERQRRLALAAEPLARNLAGQQESKIRILSFSSATCAQCHALQHPTLRRLQALCGDEIEVVEIDASGSPELASRYRILTIPSTVLLNQAGEAVAVNYGFANLHTLRQQIDASLITAQ
jgi:thioredoxin-like negative regulator of GroEL